MAKPEDAHVEGRQLAGFRCSFGQREPAGPAVLQRLCWLQATLFASKWERRRNRAGQAAPVAPRGPGQSGPPRPFLGEKGSWVPYRS